MSSWSDLPADILEEIRKRLDVVGFIRFGAVCVDWHRATKHCRTPLSRSQCGPKSRLPWLLLTSPEKPESRYLYSLSERKAHELHVPDIAGHEFMGSSHGFLISVDADANIHATNPLTGVRLPLPPTSTFPCLRGPLRADPSSSRRIAYLFEDVASRPNRFQLVPIDVIRNYLLHNKAILSPCADAIAVINSDFQLLAFARPGDESWGAHFEDRVDLNFQDAIFHKGRLHAMSDRGKLVVFDPEPPSTVPFFVTYPGPELHICYASRGLSKRYLVESPDGESLFLVKRYSEVDADDVTVKTTYVKVSILVDQTWTPVKEVGDIAFFLGWNYSISVSAKEYPCIKGNHVYLTQDENDWLLGYREEAAGFGVEVFNLEDGSIEPLYSDVDEDVIKLNASPPLWFMPLLNQS